MYDETKTTTHIAAQMRGFAKHHQEVYNESFTGTSDITSKLNRLADTVENLEYYYPEEKIETREEMEAMEFYTPFMVRFPNGAQMLVQKARGNTWFSTWKGEVNLDEVWDLIHKGSARVFALPCPPREVDLKEDVEE